ncbi:histone acetyltransferase [Gorgonomyces haynaldii]|nr:histone acetyltransferase [Gorgonomyces haynaldii]
MVKLLEAKEDQVGIILDFIKQLADYEKLLHTVTATEDTLRGSMFGDHRVAKAVIAWDNEEPVGMALYFYNFSTFTGRPGIYLEDLFVKPESRGKGIGKLFFKYLAQKCIDENCTRFEWQVIDWNQPARDFYKRMGAQENTEWIPNRVSGESLAKLAQMEL